MSSSPLPLTIRSTMASFALVAVALAGCATPSSEALGATERAAIADTLQRMIVSAYDISKPGDAVARMMSLYPSNGPVVSASGGRVVECRFYGGMSIEETAEALETSPATVKRDWTMARAYLNRELAQ